MASSEASVYIFGIDDPKSPIAVDLIASPTQVGRDATNDIVLADPFVSRHHLRLTKQGNIWFVSCSPGAEMFVNGLLTTQSRLSNGDQLVIGGTVLRFQADAQGTPPHLLRTVRVSEMVPELVVRCNAVSFSAPLREETITIGRDPQNSLIVPSHFLSRQHAIIRRQQDGQYAIKDLGSNNGIDWHGQRVQHHILHEGDHITIGTAGDSEQVSLTYHAPRTAQAVGPVQVGSNITDITLGRDVTCSSVLSSPLVSRRHAQLQRDPNGRVFITDLNSSNGTFVNEQRITHAQIEPGDRIAIGPYRFVYDGTKLQTLGITSGIRIIAQDLVKQTSRRRVILNHVSLSVSPGEFICIAGGSGAGKSTLMKALAGVQRAQSGLVTFDGIDSYAHAAYFRGHLGYLPQANTAHRELTAERAMYYTARLRLAADLSEDEIMDRISTVLDTVSLLPHRHTAVAQLSGGEQRRLNLAQELLADPPLLILDEPGAGLDPDIHRALRQTLRHIAATGKTVVLVTHHIADIVECDRVAFMGAGGQMCFMGPPAAALSFFQVGSYEDLYAKVGKPAEAAQWRNRFDQSALYDREVRQRLAQMPQATSSILQRNESQTRLHRLSAVAQTRLLAERYVEILIRDWKNLVILLLQAPVLAGVLALVSPTNIFGTADVVDAQKVLFALAIAAILLSTINAVRQISKENDIYLREHLSGLGVWPYLMSKLVVLTAIGAVQASLLVTIVMSHTGLPPSRAELFFPPIVELIIGVFLATFAGSAQGLCVSAFANTQEMANTIAPLLLIPQLLLAGVIFILPGPAQVPADLMVSRWTVQALGTSANLDHLYFAELAVEYPVLANTPPSAQEIAGNNVISTSDYDSHPTFSHYVSYPPDVGKPVSTWADAVTSRRSHLLLCWGTLIALGIAFIVITAVRQWAKGL